METATLLKNKLLERLHHNPRYSLRAFARDLALSHCFLSQVMNGRRRLGCANAIRIASLLRLSEAQATALIEQATPTRPAPSRRVSAAACEPDLTLEIDRFRAVSDWYHGAILELTVTRGFKPSPRWIARRLGLTPSVVSSAARRLERLGLLERSRTDWRRTTGHVYFPAHRPESAIRRFHEQMIEKSKEALALSDEAAYRSRDITGLTLAIDPARLPEARGEIRRFRRRLAKLLQKGETSEVYQLNVQLFNLTRGQSRRRAREKRGRQ